MNRLAMPWAWLRAERSARARRRLEAGVEGLRKQWSDGETRWRVGDDKRGDPVLVFAHWTGDTEGWFVSLLVYTANGEPAMRVQASVPSGVAELIDMAGTRRLNRGLGTLALTFLEEIVRELGATRIEGWLSPVDLDHRDRQLHFYRKNGYALFHKTVGRRPGDWIAKDLPVAGPYP